MGKRNLKLKLGALKGLALAIVALYLLVGSKARAGHRATTMMGKHSPACGPIKFVQAVPGYSIWNPGMGYSVNSSGQLVNVGGGATAYQYINETAGNLLVAMVMAGSGGQSITPNETFTISDTMGNTFYPGPIYSNGSGAQSSAIQFFYAPNIKGGGNQVTVTAAGNGLPSGATGLFMAEYSGIATTDVVDVSTGQTAPSASLSVFPGNMTTSTACDLVVGAFVDGLQTSCDYPSASGGWLMRNIGDCPSSGFVDNVHNGAAANSVVNPIMYETNFSDANWVAAQIAFRAANTTDLAQPTQLAFPSPSLTLASWTCTSLTIQSQNASGQATNTSQGILLNLSSANANFYADPNCQFPITSTLIGAGTNTQNFYFMTTALGSPAISVAASGFATVTQTETVNSANPFTWIGSAGGSGCTSSPTWQNGACWSGGVAPNSTNVAIFDGTCTSTCSPVLNPGGINMVLGIVMSADTLTTITQTTQDIQIGVGGFVQYGGTFVGATDGTNRLFSDGPLILAGGSFTAPLGSATTASIIAAGYVQSGGTFTGSTVAAAATNFTWNGGNSFTLSGGTFNTPAGTLTVGQKWTVSNSPTYNVTPGSVLMVGLWSRENMIVPGSVVYGNVVFGAECSTYNLNGQTMTIAGSLTIGGIGGGPGGCTAQLFDGTIQLSGDLIGAGDQTGFGTWNATIILTGNPAGQTVYGNGDPLPNLTIAAGPNPVTLNGNVMVDGFTMTSVGTWTTAGSTLTYYCMTGSCRGSQAIFSPGNFTYNNLVLEGSNTNFDLGGAAVTLTGNLTLGDRGNWANFVINNGSLSTAGNVTALDAGYGGDATIVLVGNPSGQTVFGAGAQIPRLTVAAGSDQVTFNGNLMVSGYTYASGVLSTAGSTLTLSCIWSDVSCNSMPGVFAPGTVTYNNVVFNGIATTVDLAGITMNIAGNLTLSDQGGSAFLNNGTLNVAGNLSTSLNGNPGNANIVLIGNSSGQTVSGTYGALLPSLTLATGSNPVTLSGSIFITAGYNVISSGALTATGSTLNFYCQWNFSYCGWGQTVFFVPGSGTYNNIAFAGYSGTVNLGGGTVNVGGTLTFGETFSFGGASSDFITGGVFSIAGGLVSENSGDGGDVQLTFVGAGAQVLSLSPGAALPTGNVSVNLASGGSLSLQSNVVWPGTGQNLTISGGTMSMAGNSMTVPGVLTIGTGATLTEGGGSLTDGSLVNNGTLNP